MKVGIYAILNQGTPEDMYVDQLIEIMRKLSPTVLSAALGVAVGYRVNITIPETNWGGQEARDAWKVKHDVNVEQLLCDIADYFPINCAMVKHIASQAYVNRNRTTPLWIGDYVWQNYSADLKRKLFTADAAFIEPTDPNSPSGSMDYAASLLYCILTESFCSYISEDVHGVDSSNLRVRLITNAEESITKAMANEEIPSIDVCECRYFISQVIDATLSVLNNSLPFTDMAIRYISENCVPNYLPENAPVLTDSEKVNVAELIEGLRQWKI